jgi:hypothetical protein
MNTHSVYSLILGAFLLQACASESPDADRTDLAPVPAAPAIDNGTQAIPAAATTAAPNTSGQMLNPAHGEPGHVCELPVGAPLDGSAAEPASGPGTSQSITIGGDGNVAQPTFSAPAPNANGSGKINPPHGQPGHVCEVPVGQPLP